MLNHQGLWETHFPEFIRSGEAKVISLMESATLANIASGQQVFAAGSKCGNYL